MENKCEQIKIALISRSSCTILPLGPVMKNKQPVVSQVQLADHLTQYLRNVVWSAFQFFLRRD
jgi:hypothetical protein